MKIILIRHGLSEANKNRIIAGSTDVPLSDEGRERLHELKSILNYPKADVYISSPLIRAVDTLKIIYGEEQSHRIDEDFKELSFGELEGLSYEMSDLNVFFEHFLNNASYKGGELYDNFYKRILKGLKKLLEELQDKNLTSAVVVAHSVVIKTLALNASKLEKSEFENIHLTNGYGFIIDVDLVDGKVVFNSCEEITKKD